MRIRCLVATLLIVAVGAQKNSAAPEQETLYSQLSNLYEESLVQEIAVSDKTLLKQAAELPELGRILTKSQAVDDVVPEAVIEDEDMEPEKLLEIKLPKATKTLDRIQQLKAYCVAAADKAAAINKEHDSMTKSPLSAFIQAFAVKADNIVVQYGSTVGTLKNQFPKGLGEYLLGYLDKATVFGETADGDTLPRGAVTLGRDAKMRTTVRINHLALGLDYEPHVLDRLAVSVSDYSHATAITNAATKDADHLAAAECLTSGQTAKYKTFLDAIKAKYGVKAQTLLSKRVKNGIKYEQGAYAKHGHLAAQPPAAEVGINAVKGEDIPSEAEMEKQAADLAKQWAAGHSKHCQDIQDLIEDIITKQKKIVPCAEMEGDYEGVVNISVVGPTFTGFYYSSRYQMNHLSGTITENNDKECIGTGGGPMVNDNESGDRSGPNDFGQYNFTYDKHTSTLIWESGNKWEKADRTPEPTPVPTPPPTKAEPYETLKDLKISPGCSEAEEQGILGETFTADMCFMALKAHPLFNYAELSPDLQCDACILLDGPRAVYEKTDGWISFKRGIGHTINKEESDEEGGAIDNEGGGGEGPAPPPPEPL